MSPRLIVPITAALIVMQGSNAHAWGRVGHQTTAALADQLICPAARRETRRLLATENSDSLAHISRWADSERALNPNDPTVHSVRTPIGADRFDEERDCGRRQCAVTAIRANFGVLADRTRDDASRLRALKFLVHLVGDIHQPMHTVGEKKRLVDLNGRVMRLHRYWDSGLFRASRARARDLLSELRPRSLRSFKSGDRTDVADWATESHGIVRDHIAVRMFTSHGGPALITKRLQRLNLSIAKERIALGGARLAILLNRALGCQ